MTLFLLIRAVFLARSALGVLRMPNIVAIYILPGMIHIYIYVYINCRCMRGALLFFFLARSLSWHGGHRWGTLGTGSCGNWFDSIDRIRQQQQQQKVLHTRVLIHFFPPNCCM